MMQKTRMMLLRQINSQACLAGRRAFSSALLVPVESRDTELPFEAQQAPRTEALMEEFYKKCDEYNALCLDQLKTINENKIANVVSRGGLEGWHTVRSIYSF